MQLTANREASGKQQANLAELPIAILFKDKTTLVELFLLSKTPGEYLLKGAADFSALCGAGYAHPLLTSGELENYGLVKIYNVRLGSEEIPMIKITRKGIEVLEELLATLRGEVLEAHIIAREIGHVFGESDKPFVGNSPNCYDDAGLFYRNTQAEEILHIKTLVEIKRRGNPTYEKLSDLDQEMLFALINCMQAIIRVSQFRRLDNDEITTKPTIWIASTGERAIKAARDHLRFAGTTVLGAPYKDAEKIETEIFGDTTIPRRTPGIFVFSVIAGFFNKKEKW